MMQAEEGKQAAFMLHSSCSLNTLPASVAMAPKALHYRERQQVLFACQDCCFSVQTDCGNRDELTWACLPCTEKNEASKRLYSTSFPKRFGVP